MLAADHLLAPVDLLVGGDVLALGQLAADGAILARNGSRRRCSSRAVPLGLLAGGVGV
jgi:hypothetical protein